MVTEKWQCTYHMDYYCILLVRWIVYYQLIEIWFWFQDMLPNILTNESMVTSLQNLYLNSDMTKTCHCVQLFEFFEKRSLPEETNESAPNNTSLPSLIASWTSSSRTVSISSAGESSDTSAIASKFAMAAASVSTYLGWILWIKGFLSPA